MDSDPERDLFLDCSIGVTDDVEEDSERVSDSKESPQLSSSSHEGVLIIELLREIRFDCGCEKDCLRMFFMDMVKEESFSSRGVNEIPERCIVSTPLLGGVAASCFAKIENKSKDSEVKLLKLRITPRV